MKPLYLMFGVIAAAALISACGQKGALYLPPRNGTVVTRPATQTTPPSDQTTPAQPQQGQPHDKNDKDDKDTSQSPPQ